MSIIRSFYNGRGRDRHDDVGLPELRRVQVTIDPSEIATLFSLPVVLIPAKANRIAVVTHLHVRKEAGVAWVVGASGVLGVRFAAPGSFQFNQFNQAITTDFFGADEDVWVGEAGAGSFAALGWTTGTAFINGAAVTLCLASADISGGTGKLIANVWYREWPGLGIGGAF